MQDITTRGFLELGEKYVTGYLAGTFTESMITNLKAVRECLYECYLILTRSKHLLPIEAMTLEGKNDLWNECKKYCEPLSSVDRIKFVKAYAALSCLMKNRL